MSTAIAYTKHGLCVSADMGRGHLPVTGGFVKRSWCWLILVSTALAAPAWACSVPVFRYALERWPVAPYEVYVFHRGPLVLEDRAVVDQLRAAGRTESRDSVIDLRIIDLAARPDGDAVKVWQRQSSAVLPWVVVRYPSDLEIPEDVWTGPLSAEVVGRLMDSPARRKVARRILEGECGVFVFLESGDRAKDDAAAALLETELKRLEKTLDLPEPEDGTWDDPQYDAEGPPNLRIAFSVLRVSRTDPAEEFFVKMLLGGAPKALDVTGPAVFPLFGRGRALCGLTGKALSQANIEDVCDFLIGPCSCIVKDQNPGVDMLMAVDWDAALAGKPSAIPSVEAPPLAGVSDFVPAGAKAAATEPLPGRGRAGLVWGVLAAVGGGVVIVAVVALVVWRKGRSAGT